MKAFPYHHAVVADLAWVIKSPSMLNAPLAVFQAAHDGDERLAEWLSVLDSDPLSLKDYLEKNTSSRFLGPYFENLWCFYLEWHPRFELVERNLQVFDQGETIGEFDVLVFDKKRGCHFHQELAVKFYLGQKTNTEKDAGTSQWFGPNRSDRLEKKYTNIMKRQIRLSEHPAAERLLRDKGITSVSHQLVFKGYLFQPYRRPLTLPAYVNEQCEQGVWMEVSAFLDLLENRHFSGGEQRWLVLQKSQWFSRKAFSEKHGGLWLVLETEELPDYLSERRESLPLTVVELYLESGVYIENRRFMLTPSGWENRQV
ncbi:MAG: DUF1853 family protein [Pseudomonadales bacterium]|nr:DUF1853 family protein [Pseudomonadales bacterium]